MNIDETQTSQDLMEPAAIAEVEAPGPENGHAPAHEHEGGRPITAVEPPPDRRTMRRRVLGLAWPVIGENLLETLLGIVDTVLVAALGTAAIAGVGSGLQIMFFLMAALSALAVGSSVLVAQAIGGGDTGRASQLARQSLIWSALLSIPLAICGLIFADPIMSVFGLDPEVQRIAVSYVRITMGTVVVLVALFIGSGVLRGAGDSRTPLRVTAIANVINVGLAYGLIYGELGMPELGAAGSAWATFLARAVALVLLLGALWRGRNGLTISGAGSWRPSFAVARDVLRLGVPAALEQVLTSAAFLMLAIIVARLGTTILAAQRISFTALSFSFLPGFGFAMAATALVGQSVGARRIQEGRAAARIATGWSAIWMGAIGLVILVFATPIMRVFTAEPDVIRIGADGLRVVALAQPFWAVLFVQAGALRGTGNTRFPLIANGGGIWISVLLAWALLNTVGGGLISVWAAFLITSPLIGLANWIRFHRRVAEVEMEQAS